MSRSEQVIMDVGTAMADLIAFSVSREYLRKHINTLAELGSLENQQRFSELLETPIIEEAVNTLSATASEHVVDKELFKKNTVLLVMIARVVAGMKDFYLDDVDANKGQVIGGKLSEKQSNEYGRRIAEAMQALVRGEELPLKKRGEQYVAREAGRLVGVLRAKGLVEEEKSE